MTVWSADRGPRAPGAVPADRRPPPTRSSKTPPRHGVPMATSDGRARTRHEPPSTPSDAGPGPVGDQDGAAAGLATGPRAAAAPKTDDAPPAAQQGPTSDPPDLEPATPDPSLVHRIAPLFKLLRLYSRLEVEGVEHIPDGPAILVANHTGWTGLDYAYAALTVHDTKKRFVRGLAHKTWFMREKVAGLARRLGLIEVSKDAMETLVARGELVLIFPEGERGAFKGEKERYMLQPFARGYVRVALKTGVPIVPVAIVGGEEANPSSRRIDSYEDILDLSLPMPVNFFPRPVKWRISFLPPVTLEGGEEAAADRDLVHRINDRIRQDVQDELHRLVSVRGNPFL